MLQVLDIIFFSSYHFRSDCDVMIQQQLFKNITYDGPSLYTHCRVNMTSIFTS